MMGGSLYQDIPAQLPQAVTHGGGALHKIKPQPGTVLARLYGTDSLEVNSYHHQAVKDPAPGIRIAAYSPEGIVEAYETDQVLAVQFHPEKDLKRGDDRWLPLFQEFTGRCK
jgi:putative glutamine amidotransferase